MEPTREEQPTGDPARPSMTAGTARAGAAATPPVAHPTRPGGATPEPAAPDSGAAGSVDQDRRASTPAGSDHAARRRATLIGLGAIVLWSAMVGLTRIVAGDFGPVLGIALIHTLATALLFVIRRPRRWRSLPPRYLLFCGGLFVVYEVAVGLSVGLAADANQALEVGIVNYLWPMLTVVLSVAVRPRPRQRLGWMFLPGIALAVVGVALVVGGDAGLDVARMGANVAANPVPYLLALVAAVSWALYSVLSPRLAQGHDAITLFFVAATVTLWILQAVDGDPLPSQVSAGGVVALAVLSLAIGGGYACWNIGILRGHLTVLASASYATPVLSSAFGALLLSATLTLAFWQGVVCVAVGSLLGWWATRPRTPS